MAVATYAVVFDRWRMGITLADAVDMDGAVIEAVVSAYDVGLVGVGDLVARVNNVSVLGMAFSDVAILLRSLRPSLRVIEFVPSHVRGHAQRVVEESKRHQEPDTEPQSVPDHDDLHKRLVENPHTIIKTGRVLVQDRSVMGSSVARAWHSWHVVLRLAGLTYAKAPGTIDMAGELSFVGRQCAVRPLTASSETEEAEHHALELRVDDQLLVLAYLTIDYARQLWRLHTHEPKVLTDSQFQAARQRIRPLASRLTEIIHAIETHPDPRILASLQEESQRLEYDQRVTIAAIKAFEAAEDGWDQAHEQENDKALRTIRRCLPVECRTMSEAELLASPSPSGLFMSSALAHKLKATSVLALLRADRDNIIMCAPSALEAMHVDGLALAERRALHERLRQCGKMYNSRLFYTDTRGLDKRKWEWFRALKETFRHVLAAYDRHVAAFGSPDNHPYATEDEPANGCPLRGIQCPVRAEWESQALYAQDLGYPEGDVFTTVRLPFDDRMIGMSGNRVFDGFLRAPAADSYGASSFWLDPKLLELKLDANALSLAHVLSSSASASSPTEVHAGVYRDCVDRRRQQDESVAIKRLTLVGQKTLTNAIELATVAMGLHQLTHPNVASVLGLCWHKALDIQVVMPLAARGDLRSLLDSSDASSLTWNDFKCQVALDVVSALEYLYAKRRLASMGALTSWNILLDADGSAQVNLLQLPHRDVQSVRDRVRSPLRWLAPEVILGSAYTQPSVDMYAFGVLLTELDTTKLPFHDAVNPNGALMEDMLLALHVARRNLRPTLSASCPKAIVEIVEKCLSPDPTKRPGAVSLEYQLRAILKEGLTDEASY